MSDFSLTLVLQFKTSKIINDMAKVQIKSEKITPFGGIFHVRELFSRFLGPVIDKVLGLRCTSFGYQYGEIVDSLSSVYFCGGDCVEDVTSHLMPHLSLHPTLRTCSSDTILRAISELATSNTTYTSETGKSYDFNTAEKLNSLLVKVLMNTGQLMAGESYDLDFDHQFIETEKYVQLVDEVEALEHEAYLTLAHLRALTLLQCAYLLSVEPILAAGGIVEQAQDVEQRRLATARWPHDGHELTFVNFERYAPKGYGLHLFRAEHLLNVF